MMLIGMLDSPFVRRVAISLDVLGMPFEHANWSVGADFGRIRRYSPLGRVPALVLDDGEVLHDSSAILDHLDASVGPERALLPGGGRERRRALQIVATAIGAAEKGREQLYERAFRPAEKRHEPWVERCRTQMHGALGELERWCAGRGEHDWLVGAGMSQADITLCCVWTFLADACDLAAAAERYPALRAFAARCEAMPVFAGRRAPWTAPGGGA